MTGIFRINTFNRSEPGIGATMTALPPPLPVDEDFALRRKRFRLLAMLSWALPVAAYLPQLAMAGGGFPAKAYLALVMVQVGLFLAGGVCGACALVWGRPYGRKNIRMPATIGIILVALVFLVGLVCLPAILRANARARTVGVEHAGG